MRSIYCVLVAAIALGSMQSHASDESFTASPPTQWPQISAINDAPFQQEQFAGNGFLLEYKSKLYAVTAKHLFFLIKSETVSAIDISADVLKRWTMHPNGDRKAIVLGRLLNADPSEAIDPSVVETDWLFFDVMKNDSKIKPLHLRESPLRAGEKVYAVGCTYQRATTCRQDVYPGTFVAESGTSILVDMEQSQRFGGLSGAPVVDVNGEVVGIVSSEKPNPNGKGMLLAPASVKYAIATLNKFH
jgi:S1-C subfamily serine protease